MDEASSDMLLMAAPYLVAGRGRSRLPPAEKGGFRQQDGCQAGLQRWDRGKTTVSEALDLREVDVPRHRRLQLPRLGPRFGEKRLKRWKKGPHRNLFGGLLWLVDVAEHGARSRCRRLSRHRHALALSSRLYYVGEIPEESPAGRQAGRRKWSRSQRRRLLIQVKLQIFQREEGRAWRGASNGGSKVRGLEPCIASSPAGEVRREANWLSPASFVVLLLLQGREGVDPPSLLLHGQLCAVGARGPGSQSQASVLGTEAGLAAGVEIKPHDVAGVAGRAEADSFRAADLNGRAVSSHRKSSLVRKIAL
ncbi:uncharacterized protein LOC119884477 [Micropterus salmoides]|uniref:uncharacterized protein LOC119884477 n=1 Tax=Micropterus salmoides TaxID=27706 RepID=UPI0018EA9768|nr:uncharacterized protein LOC119884477 [Micropterus salmoides]